MTEPMKRCLALVRKHGAVERHWAIDSKAPHAQAAWSWRIGGQPAPQQQVDKAIGRGFLVVVGRDRAVLTDRGRRLVA